MSGAANKHHRRSASRRRRLSDVARHLLLICASIIVLVPIGYMVLASFKNVADFFGNPYGLPTDWEFSNYVRAWNEAHISTTLPNTVFVTFFSVAGSTFLSSLIAYGLRLRNKALAISLYTMFVSGLLVPVQMIILPLFLLLKQIGLFGTLFALILPYIALGLPLGVLVLTPIAAMLPSDLINAARMDGANEWQIYRKIFLPLLRPGLISVAILNGVWMWNEFFIPLVLSLKTGVQTMPVGIVSFIGVYSTEWGLVFASVVISAIPIIAAYLLMTRQFQSGLTAGALKG